MQPRAITILALLLSFLISVKADGTCQFRVLAVGDSITQGVVPSLGRDHPYTIEFQRLLQQQLPCCAVIVDNAGVGGAGVFAVGDPVKTTLLPLEANILRATSKKDQKYDLAIIAGGINDLLREGKTASDIAPGFYKLYNDALATGAIVLALAPFQTTLVSKDDSKEQERRKLADLEAAFANGKDKVFPLDLSTSVLDFYSMSSQEQSKLLDDKLHLTVAGYDLVGRTIFDFIESKQSSILPSCSDSSG